MNNNRCKQFQAVVGTDPEQWHVILDPHGAICGMQADVVYAPLLFGSVEDACNYLGLLMVRGELTMEEAERYSVEPINSNELLDRRDASHGCWLVNHIEGAIQFAQLLPAQLQQLGRASETGDPGGEQLN